MKVRQPIISILAHVDHGKTTLLDYIRHSAVASKEAGGITQHIGATEIPMDNILRVARPAAQKGLAVKFPGLLFIDTPGHEAFTFLRKRGGSLADIAIVVVDVTEGFKPQTDEVISILKQYKTPFMVAANKIDRISGWIPNRGASFSETYGRQREEVRQRLDTKIYELMGQLAGRGFTSERHDRVEDFAKEVAIVPTSGITGEGVPELLAILCGLAKKYLEKKLAVDEKGAGKGTVLEVNKVKGLGTAIDAIMFDGLIKVGDELVIGHPGGAIVTKVKALLRTAPMREIRVEKQFTGVKEAVAASGVRISAPGLEEVISGFPLRAVRTRPEVTAARAELEEILEEVEIETEVEGVVIRADTIGALEALVKILKGKGVPVRKAKIGAVTKKDIVELATVKEEYRLVFAFNAEVLPEAEDEAKNIGVLLLKNNVIYRLIEDYDEHVKALEERRTEEALREMTRPAKIRMLPQFVFRQSKPAVVGFDVLGGVLAEGVRLMRRDGKVIGSVQQIKEKDETIKQAQIGSRVSVSIDGAVVGRNIKDEEELFTALTRDDYKRIKKNLDLLSDHEKNVLEEIKEIMSKKEAYWAIV